MEQTHIDTLARHLSKLPGLGKRSARRAILHMVGQKEQLMLPLIESLQKTADTMSTCKKCGNIDEQNPCHICMSEKRDKTTICVIEEVADLWAIERSNHFRGSYHVLGGVLSAIDGKGPEELRLGELLARVKQHNAKEVIIATNATVEGQTTAHYISQLLKETGVTITRLSQGLPMGGELDYLDEGTLFTALESRVAMG